MSVLLGKIKNTTEYYKFLNTPDDLYEIDIDSIKMKSYSNRERTRSKEWFQIENFSKSSFCIKLFNDFKGDAQYNQIDSKILKELNKLEYICWVKNDNQFFIQKITTGKCVVKSKAINKNFLVVDLDPFIKIEEIPDAIYIKDKDYLLFKSIKKIETIFLGINSLAKRATKEEVEMFFKNPMIKYNNSIDYQKLDNKSLEQINYAHKLFSEIEDSKKEKLIEYIKENKPEILDNKQIKIDNEKDLRYALDSIQQNFYTTPVTGEKRIVDAIIDPKNY